jgi:periplasmic divalent cation tolerance protein
MDDDTTSNSNNFVQSGGACLLLSTAPNEETASQLARLLVNAGLAACVSLLPQLRSIYRWNDTIQDEAEVLMLIKTTRTEAAAASELLRQEHPYDCPEILAFDAVGGLEAYLTWLSSAVSPSPTSRS